MRLKPRRRGYNGTKSAFTDCKMAVERDPHCVIPRERCTRTAACEKPCATEGSSRGPGVGSAIAAMLRMPGRRASASVALSRSGLVGGASRSLGPASLGVSARIAWPALGMTHGVGGGACVAAKEVRAG
jgi:hypothetical protein